MKSVFSGQKLDSGTIRGVRAVAVLFDGAVRNAGWNSGNSLQNARLTLPF